MNEMAAVNGLEGYNAEDSDFLITIYYRYYDLIIFSLMGLSMIALVFALVRKLKYNKRPVFAGLVLAVFLIGVFYMVNFGRQTDYGIINDISTPLMAGPSSASEIITMLDPGHKMKVLGEEDVWVKVAYKGGTAFIKMHHLDLLDTYL